MPLVGRDAYDRADVSRPVAGEYRDELEGVALGTQRVHVARHDELEGVDRDTPGAVAGEHEARHANNSGVLAVGHEESHANTPGVVAVGHEAHRDELEVVDRGTPPVVVAVDYEARHA